MDHPNSKPIGSVLSGNIHPNSVLSDITNNDPDIGSKLGPTSIFENIQTDSTDQNPKPNLPKHLDRGSELMKFLESRISC